MIKKHKFDFTAMTLLLVALIMLFSGIAAVVPPRAKAKSPDPTSIAVAADDYASRTDEQYKYVPMGENDTGRITLATNGAAGGQINTVFNLTQERWGANMTISQWDAEFQNPAPEPPGKWILGSWSGSKADVRSLKDNAVAAERKPVFGMESMQRIAASEELDAPVMMLNNSGQDEAVLFELTNLAAINMAEFDIDPDEITAGVLPNAWIKYNGDYINPKVNLIEGVNAVAPAPVGAADNNPDSAVDPIIGMGWHSLDQNDIVSRGGTAGNDETYSNHVWSPYRNYIAYNKAGAPTLRAMFDKEGLYEFCLPVAIVPNGVYQTIVLRFSFYIVDASQYSYKPGLNTAYRNKSGNSEIYNYVFNGERPSIEYNRLRYDISDVADDYFSDTGVITADGEWIKTTREGVLDSDGVFTELVDERVGPDVARYDFSKVGQYTIKSIMMYRDYLGKYVALERYTGYTIILYIYGFQPYYGRIVDGVSTMTAFWDDNVSNGDDGTADATTPISRISYDTLNALYGTGMITDTDRNRYNELAYQNLAAATANQKLPVSDTPRAMTYLQTLTSYLDVFKKEKAKFAADNITWVDRTYGLVQQYGTTGEITVGVTPAAPEGQKITATYANKEALTVGTAEKPGAGLSDAEAQKMLDMYDELTEDDGYGRLGDGRITLGELEKYRTVKNAQIIPVMTNCPPVQLSGNVDFARGDNGDMLSVVAFHGEADFGFNGVKNWRYSTLTVGKPFSDPGEYIVTLYFNAQNKLQRQTFYFHISNTTEMMFDLQDGSGPHSFADVLYKMNGQIIPEDAGRPIVVTFPDEDLGAYQIRPIFELEFQRGFVGNYKSLEVGDYMQEAGTDNAWTQEPLQPVNETVLDNNGDPFTVTHYKYELQNGAKQLSIGGREMRDTDNNGIDDWDGRYRLSVNFGAFRQSNSVIEVVLDTSGAGVITATPSWSPAGEPDYYRLPNTPTNTAVFGIKAIQLNPEFADDPKKLTPSEGVSLSWGVHYADEYTSEYSLKPSGIGFQKKAAIIDYWQFSKQTTDANAYMPTPGSYEESAFVKTDRAQLFSMSNFSYWVTGAIGQPTRSTPTDGEIIPLSTGVGWKISTPFVDPGLYRIKITDDVNITTEFILIIDDTAPAYTQSIVPDGSKVEVNMIDYDPGKGVEIAFGQWKVVTTDAYNRANITQSALYNAANNPRGLIFNDPVYDSLKNYRYGLPNTDGVRPVLGSTDARGYLVDAYNIPIEKVEISKDGEEYVTGGAAAPIIAGGGYPSQAVLDKYKTYGKFVDDNVNALENGYFLLRGNDKNGDGVFTPEEDNIEGTYYLRITDRLKNVTEMFVILSHDKSMGTAFANNNVTLGPTETAALVDVKGGVTNSNHRRYVTFSFYQPGPMSNSNYFVSYVDVYRYTFNWQEYANGGVNRNYPFQPKGTPPEGTAPDGQLIGRWKYASSVRDDNGAVPDSPVDGNVIFRDKNSRQDRLAGVGTKYIQLFTDTATGTLNGIYQIVRHYGQPTANSAVFPGSNPEYDKKVREYYFVVDDTGMLSYDINTYQTELKVKFGDRPDDTIQYRNLAQAADFDEKHNILESNLEATIQGAAGKFRTNPRGPVGADKIPPNTYELHSEGYRWTAGSTEYTGDILASHEFPGLVPRYTIENNKKPYVTIGRGTEIYAGSGNPADPDNPDWRRLGRQSTDVNYNLLIQDGARAFSFLQTAGGSGEVLPDNEPTSANYGLLRMRINVRDGSRGDFLLNGMGGGRPTGQRRMVSGPVAGSTVVYSNNAAGTAPTYTTIMNPNNLKPNDKLTFEFQNDPKSFISYINTESAGVSTHFWQKTNGPSSDREDLTGTRSYDRFHDIGRIVNGVSMYRYDMSSWDNSPNSALNNYNDSDRFVVTLTTVDKIVTTFVLIMDTMAPTYNLTDKNGNIRSQDTVARDVPYETLNSTPTYIYGMANSFDFANRYYSETENEDFFFGVKYEPGSADTPSRSGITYALIEDPTTLYTTKVTEFNINDSTMFSLMPDVNLLENETQYYLITETDFAGNRSQYIVQMKGQIFDDSMKFNGALPPVTGDLRVFGINMSVSDIMDFWRYNSSFRIECDENNWYYAFDKTATWKLNGQEYSALKDSVQFETLLDTWIDQYAQNEEKIEFRIRDRFGAEKLVSFYNINDNTGKAELEAYYNGPTVNVRTNNLDELPAIIKDATLLDRYDLKIWEMGTDGYLLPTAMSPGPGDLNLPNNTQILNNFVKDPLNKKLLIQLTDPFGRKSYTLYYGQEATIFDLKYYGNTVEVSDTAQGINKTMVGDKRGVDFQYTEEHYNITIRVFPDGKYYPGDTGAAYTVNFTDIQRDSTGVMRYTFTPETLNPITLEPFGDALYEVIAYGKMDVPGGNGPPEMYHEFFQFNTDVPKLSFATLDNPNTAMSAEVKEVFDGAIMYIDREDSPFGGSISFTRTYDGVTDRFTIPSWLDSYTLTNPGKYKITVRNSLWAEAVYDMEVIETSGSILKVVDDIGGEAQELAPSPVGASVTFAVNPMDAKQGTVTFTTAAGDVRVDNYTKIFTEETVAHMTDEKKTIQQYVFSYRDSVYDYYPALPVSTENPEGKTPIYNTADYNTALAARGLDFYSVETADMRQLVREQPLVSVPPINNRQIIGMKIGNYYTKNNYFYMPAPAIQSNTLIWCLARPIYDNLTDRNIVDFASPIYFATVGAKENQPLSSNVGVKLTDVGTNKEIFTAGERYRLYATTDNNTSIMKPDVGNQSNTGFPKSGINVSIKYPSSNHHADTVTDQSANNANILRMEYFKDGVPMGTITGTDSLVIMPEHAGRYDFYVYDMVGNPAQFGGGTAERPYIDHYTLINLSKPFGIINNSVPVPGAVYNDSVDLYITDVQYAETLFGADYFSKYFYISNLTVRLDDVEQEAYAIPQINRLTGERPLLEEKKHNRNRFTFTARGRYQVDVRYIIGPAMYVTNTYTFQIVPSILPVEQFEYIIVSNIKITKVTRNGYNITNNYDLSAGAKIAFAVGDGVGEYMVYGETEQTTISRSIPLSFKVSIDRKKLSESIWVDGVGSGASVNTPVTLNYRPYYLYNDGLQRPVTIAVYNNGFLVANEDNPFPIVVDEATVNALKPQDAAAAGSLEYQNTVNSAPLTAEGMYVVVALDQDNDVMYTYTFSIVGVKSKRGIVVGAILAGVVLIMIFVFLRIRAKMKVK